jgi:hypothetical protein
MWTADPIFFEDDDVPALLAEFIKCSIIYPDRSPFEIASYVFRNSRDPEVRSGQIATAWMKELEVTEAIRKGKLLPVDQNKIETVEQLQAKIIAVTESENIGYQQKKVMIEGYMAFAQTKGWVVKSVEKTIDDKRRRHSQIIFKRYDD